MAINLSRQTLNAAKNLKKRKAVGLRAKPVSPTQRTMGTRSLKPRSSGVKKVSPGKGGIGSYTGLKAPKSTPSKSPRSLSPRTYGTGKAQKSALGRAAPGSAAQRAYGSAKKQINNRMAAKKSYSSAKSALAGRTSAAKKKKPAVKKPSTVAGRRKYLR